MLLPAPSAGHFGAFLANCSQSFPAHAQGLQGQAQGSSMLMAVLPLTVHVQPDNAGALQEDVMEDFAGCFKLRRPPRTVRPNAGTTSSSPPTAAASSQ